MNTALDKIGPDGKADAAMNEIEHSTKAGISGGSQKI